MTGLLGREKVSASAVAAPVSADSEVEQGVEAPSRKSIRYLVVIATITSSAPPSILKARRPP